MAAKLVNLGSLCIDYVYNVPSISCAGETIASSNRQVFAGGKGLNQSIAAAHAGVEVAHFGCIGSDGQMLIDTLAQRGINTAGIRTSDQPSGHAFIQVDTSGQNSIVIHGGSNHYCNAEVRDQAFAATHTTDWLLLQNEINDLPEIMMQAAARGIRMAMNLAPVDNRINDYPFELLQLLIVNEAEAIALTGEDHPQQAFSTMAARLPQTDIVLTLGKHGALARDTASKQSFALGAYAVDAIDETAAGDAYVGYLMAAMVREQGLEAGLVSAAAAGALAVTRAGAAASIPTAANVAKLVQSQSLSKQEIGAQ